jgi:sucrose-6-phosphate hydrolase SacC (GH32 family)
MTWGHAVSEDLVHWKEQPKVLFPNDKGTCFSGAAFIDRKNQLGRKTGEEDVIVAFYLRTEIGLCLAYSNDRGYSMTDYEGNPVLTHTGARIDTPRPFWYEPTKRWIAPTYDFFTNESGQKRRCVGFYSSENLTDWDFESRVEQDGWGDELCGCVDFFQLPVDGDPKNKKWVMVMIDGSYIVGTFDGHTFYTLSGKPAVTSDRIRSLVVENGNYYATQTWHNMPNERRVQITWMRGDKFPEAPFNQQMTIPSELTLHSTEEGPRMRMNPIRELETLRTRTHEWTDVVLKTGTNPLSGLKGELLDLEVELESSAGSETIFDMHGTEVAYDSETQTLSCGGLSSRLNPVDGVIRLRILLDRTSIEVYGNDGRVYIPLIVLPEENDFSIRATCDKGEVRADYLRVHELKSTWDPVT